MSKCMKILARLTGLFSAFIASIMLFGVVANLLAGHQWPLTARIGSYGITSSSNRDMIAFVPIVVALILLAGVLLVVIPRKIDSGSRKSSAEPI